MQKFVGFLVALNAVYAQFNFSLPNIDQQISQVLETIVPTLSEIIQTQLPQITSSLDQVISSASAFTPTTDVFTTSTADFTTATIPTTDTTPSSFTDSLTIVPTSTTDVSTTSTDTLATTSTTSLPVLTTSEPATTVTPSATVPEVVTSIDNGNAVQTVYVEFWPEGLQIPANTVVIVRGGQLNEVSPNAQPSPTVPKATPTSPPRNLRSDGTKSELGFLVAGFLAVLGLMN